MSAAERTPTAELAALAAGQAALVAALTGAGPPPPGFDRRLIGVARRTLAHKRASQVARVWPMLARERGARFPTEFVAWVESRQSLGPLRDGWGFAEHLEAGRYLGRLGRRELAARRATLRDADGPTTRRRRAGYGRSGWLLVLQLRWRGEIVGAMIELDRARVELI